MAQKKRVFTGVRCPHNAGDSNPGDVVPSLLARSGSLLAKLSQVREQGGLSAASSKTPSIVIFMISFHYYYLAGKLFSGTFIFIYTSTETCGVSLVFREKQLHFCFTGGGVLFLLYEGTGSGNYRGSLLLVFKIKKVPAGMIYGSWKAIQTVNDGQMTFSPMAGSRTGSVTLLEQFTKPGQWIMCYGSAVLAAGVSVALALAVKVTGVFIVMAVQA
jgi:hypothetical protein